MPVVSVDVVSKNGMLETASRVHITCIRFVTVIGYAIGLIEGIVKVDSPTVMIPIVVPVSQPNSLITGPAISEGPCAVDIEQVG